MDVEHDRRKRKRVKSIIIDDSESSESDFTKTTASNDNNLTGNLEVIAIDDSESDSLREIAEPNYADPDFKPSFHPRRPPRPRRFTKTEVAELTNESANSEEAPLAETLLTQCTSELAMSAKKVEEIRRWLKNALAKSGPRLLVLSGPPGSGKNSAVHALCAENNCDPVEWTAPMPLGARCDIAYLLSNLEEFLVGVRYPALVNGAGQKVVLLRDIPVSLADSPTRREQLQDMLFNFAQFSPCPAVLTLSNSDKGRARAMRLIGAALLESPYAMCVKINPLSLTAMKRAVQAVAHRKKIRISSTVLAELCASCNGDLRAALNALHLHFLGNAQMAKGNGIAGSRQRGGGGGRPKKRPRREAATGSTALLNSISKDGSLGTYHAVSKVLNNKREKNGASKYKVEQILEDAQAEPQAFLAFLHQNYLDFFGSIEDCADALEILSDADCLMPWNQDYLLRSCLTDCAASVASRGFLYHNKNAVRSGWRPIRGPDSFNVASNAASFMEGSRFTFRDTVRLDLAKRSTVMDKIPYLEKVSGLQIQPWDQGISSTFHGHDSQSAAALAMVDAEDQGGAGPWDERVSQRSGLSERNEKCLPTHDSVPDDDASMQEEEIQEWDSDG